tara:strand:+ start:4938 stop:6614 length:1677 start_codon:yes stop_codon:yes gene_type:complete
MRYNKHILLEGRVEDAQQYFEKAVGSWPVAEPGNPAGIGVGTNLESVLEHFVNSDPSNNQKYLLWMVKRYLEESDTSPIDISSLAMRFDINSPRITPEMISELPFMSVNPKMIKSPKNIDSYDDLDVLERLMDEVESIMTRKDKEKMFKSEVDKVYEDDNWVIIRPKSHGASCYYGAGTKWCTTSKNKNFFEKYNREGVLYYVIKKQSGKDYKIALFKRLPKVGTDYNTNRRVLGRVPDDEWYDMEDNLLDGRTSSIVTSMLPDKAIQVIEDLYKKELDSYSTVVDFNRYKTLNQFVNLITDKLEGQRINFNTESGTWELQVVGRNEWYVNYAGDKIYQLSVEIFVDGEYEINVSDFQGSIKPTPENDLDEDIGWYFKILPEKIVEASRRIGYKEVKGIRLGLPREEVFKERFLDNDRYTTRMMFRGWPEKTFLNAILLPNLRYLLSRPEIKEITQEDSKTWEPRRGRTPLTFKYPPKEGSLTQLFVDFVKNNPGKTRKEFYDSIGRTYTPGHNSEFFAVINDSGIVKMERQGRQFVYTLGPNYEPWTRGELLRIKYR